MKKGIIHLVLAVLVFSVCAGFGCSKPLAPVTETHIAGMPLDTKTDVLSKLNTPVTFDALVQVPGKQESIIVNIFPADENGNIQSGAKPEVIMASKTDNFKLCKTMSKKKLTKGTYLMNIVYGGKTERVVFSVK
jgi:hypothetical protein